jgi:hypothetical protein
MSCDILSAPAEFMRNVIGATSDFGTGVLSFPLDAAWDANPL